METDRAHAHELLLQVEMHEYDPSAAPAGSGPVRDLVRLT